MSILLIIHLLSAVIWVGGMFFAYQCLRPVAASLLPPDIRLPLWSQVFEKFFVWVWCAIILLLISGHGMIALYGGMKGVGTHVHLMLGLGYFMVALYLHVYFALYKKLKTLVAEQRWSDAGLVLNKIRILVGVNLVIGLVTIAIASGGRYVFA